MTTLFQTLSNVLLDDEELKFSLSKDNDKLKVILQPKLGKEPEKASDEVKQIRASLALPLIMTMTAEELDANFFETVSQYGNARQQVNSNIETVLESLKEAGKAAKSSTKGKTKSTPPKPTTTTSEKYDDKEDTSEESAPTATQPAKTGTNPTSLI